MKKAQLVHICGDIHADWGALNAFINTKIRHSKLVRSLADDYDVFEAVILQCGDFGYWPHTQPRHRWFEPGDFTGDGGLYAVHNAVPFLKSGMVSIYWCDGNHENHDALDALEESCQEQSFIPVSPGVFFARFGSILTLIDDTAVMFCGGAESMDKDLREPGFSWWPQEGIDEADMRCLPDPRSVHVDWLVSHTCPRCFGLVGPHIMAEKILEKSPEHLDRVWEMYRPKKWWFGHYHAGQLGEYQGCRWTLLDYPGNGLGPWFETILVESDGE
jgi:hypothetical protein